LLLVFAPLVEATAAKFALFMPEVVEVLLFRDILQPIDVIEPEGRVFDLIFDVAPEDGLDIAPFFGEQAQSKFIVNVLGNDLGIVVNLENDRFAIGNDRDTVVALAGQFPYQGAVIGGDIGNLELLAAVLQNAPLREAKRAPGELYQIDHVYVLRDSGRADKRKATLHGSNTGLKSFYGR
jgi:hypothetical protein